MAGGVEGRAGGGGGQDGKKGGTGVEEGKGVRWERRR